MDPFANYARGFSGGSVGASPYAAMFGQTRNPSANDLLPTINPADERSTAGWALENALGGLGYIGSLFDKTFGGRAIRGALGGHPEELLSTIPLSDTLGLTDPQNEVSGRDLLAQAGLVDRRNPDEPFSWTQDIPGMLAEVALDPSTYASLGLTAAGKVAQKSATGLAKGFGAQLRAGERGLTFNLPFRSGAPLEALTGQQVLSAADWARSGVTMPTRGIDAALNSTLGITPLAGAQRRIYDNVLEPVTRYLKPVFGPEYKNATTAPGQDVAVATDLLEQQQQFTRGQNAAQRMLDVNQIAGANADPTRIQNVQQALQGAIEDATKSDLLPTFQTQAKKNIVETLGQYLTPSDKAEIENVRNFFTKGVPYAPLSPYNEATYKAAVSPADDAFFRGVLPGSNVPMPTDNASATLLHAGRDLMDQGYHVQPNNGNLLFDPTALNTEAKDKIFDRILNKNYAPGTIDYQGLTDWIHNKPNAGINDLNLTGPLAANTHQAVLDAMTPPTRVGPVSGKATTPRPVAIRQALDYKPPEGNRDWEKWTAANLSPDEKLAFDGLVTKEKGVLAGMKDLERQTGAQGGLLTDSFIDYAPRHMSQFPKGDPRAEKSPSWQQFSKDLRASNDAFEQRKSYLRNVPGGTSTINSWAKDARFSGKNATMHPDQAQAFIRKELTGMETPAKGNPAWREATEIEQFLRSLPEHHVANQVPFFSADLPKLMLNREKGANKVGAAGFSFEDMFKRFGADRATLEAAGHTDLTSAEEIAKAMNLTGIDAGGSIVAQKLASSGKIPSLSTGDPLKLSDLANVYIPSDVAKDMLAYGKGFQTPKILEPIVKMYDEVANLTRGWLTRPFLSFHTRNLVSGLFNTWRSGAIGVNPREELQTARGVIDFLRGHGQEVINSTYGSGNSTVKMKLRVPRGVSADDHAASLSLAPGWKTTRETLEGVTDDELWKELVASRIAFAPNATMAADVLGAGGEIVQQGIRKPAETGNTILQDIGGRLKDEVKNPTLNPLNKDNSLIKVMSEGGQQVEDFIRVNHYVNLRKQGWSPEAAGREVQKYQIDYSRLSDTEKGLFKRIHPWYSFSKGTLPVILEDLVGQTGKITAPVRAVTGGRPQGEFVPSYIGEGAALPLGTNEDGTARYLSSFGLPIEDDSFKLLGSLLKGDLSRGLEMSLGAAYPWIKSPLEMAFNKQLFTGRPLTDLKPYEFADLGGLLSEQQARGLTEIAANTPASRTLSTVNKLLDERKSPIDQIISLVTGAKLTDVDAERSYNSSITKGIGDQLMGHPGVRTREEVYVPTDLISQMTPEDQVKYRLYLSAEQRLRDSAKLRKQQQP
jgi:hypothetical protein